MPRDILFIAAHLKRLYDTVYGSTPEDESDLTEMKMHKLLYFAQKKHYENFGEWLFEDDFEGWVHGPVNRRVRQNFMFLSEDLKLDELTPKEEYTIREVVYDYGKYSSFVLRDLSHQDFAYKKSRKGLAPDERGDSIIRKEDIIYDIANAQTDDEYHFN